MILRAVESSIKFSLRHLKPDWNNFVPTIDTGGSALRNKYVFSLRRIEGIFAITIFFFFFSKRFFLSVNFEGEKELSKILRYCVDLFSFHPLSFHLKEGKTLMSL